MAKEAYKYPFYVVGNGERGKEVIDLLKSKGGSNPSGLVGDCRNGIYYIRPNGEIDATSRGTRRSEIICAFLEELTLPEPKWEPKRGEHILVRISGGYWEEAIFSYYKNEMYHTVGGNSFYFARKFDENLLGTTV